MSYRHLLVLLGIALILLGAIEGRCFFIIVWLGADFLILGIAHGRNAAGIFGKRKNGTLPLWSWILFLPLHLYTISVWYLLRSLSPEPAQNEISEQLVVGRRLLPSEVKGEFDTYIDLTAEFNEPYAIRRLRSYCNFPILDGGAPKPEELILAVANLKPGRTFIHCAQGHGRTGLFTLAVLLHTGAVESIETGLQMLATARPAIHLNKEQRHCIELCAHKLINSRSPRV